MPQAVGQTQSVFWLLHRKITAVFHQYISTGDSSLAANTAIEIYVENLAWARFLSEDPRGKYHKPELFDEVLARVMQQGAAASLPVTWQQNLLVQLCLHCLISSHNPIGSLNVQTLVTEIGTHLISLRTQLLDFIQDDTTDSADISTTVERFTNLGSFMSAMSADATNRPAYPLDVNDLWSLGQVGLELVLGIVKVDNDFDIYEDLIRLNIFKVCITWLDENEEFLSKEICHKEDLYLCVDRLCSFVDSDWLELTDAEGEYPALAHKAKSAVLVMLRNAW